MKKNHSGLFTFIYRIIGKLSCSPVIPKAGDFLFKNVNIIPMSEEKVLENYSIFISNGKIKAIGKFEELKYPATTDIIDGQNKYIVPGFSDMHIHSTNFEDGVLYLANGVTLVRNMAGYRMHLLAKKMIKDKQLLGPEIFSTTPIIDGKDPFWPRSFVIKDSKKVEAAIKKMKKVGYDAIKVYYKLSKSVYDKIMETAKKLNIPVVGHVPYDVGITDVIKAGQHSNEHFTGYNLNSETEENINLTIKAGIWNCPTLVVYQKIFNIPALKKTKVSGLQYVHPIMKKFWSTYDSSKIEKRDGNKEFLKMLYNRGARIVAGTDVGNPYVIAGFSLHEEFQLMHEAGLTPYQVLLTGTKNAAKMLGIEERLGTIEAGKDADLVLLNKNPLEDIKNTKTIAGVMTKGVWFSNEELQHILDKIEKKFNK